MAVRGEAPTDTIEMTDRHTLRVSARTARLTASDDDDDGPPWRFSGIAVAAGDILHMQDGTPVLFTAEELRAAAETQTDEPLTTDHPTDETGAPLYPPPTDETVGRVAKAGWLESQQAVGYDATTHDEDVATGVKAGTFDVSVHPAFELGAQDPETGAYVAENIQFRDLSVVSKGDSPSNTAEWGPNQALASYTRQTDIGAELTAGDSRDDDREGVIQAAVRGAVEAITGANRQETMGAATDTDGDDADGSDTPADTTSTPMDDTTRQAHVRFITAHADYDESTLDAMDDDVLEQTYELVAEASDDGADGDGTTGDGAGTDDDDDDGGDDPTLADMTVSELGEALREQGFVTEADATDFVDEATAQATKAEKVDEIIANSDDYDADDREDLLASADTVIDREHERVTGTPPAQLPGSAGLAASATPTFDDADADDLDAYGTGVADN